MLIHAVALTAALATQTRSPSAVSGAALDELIANLPAVGFESDPMPEPPWRALRPGVATMQECVAEGTLTDDQWRRALTRTGVVRWREAWPREVPFAISMQLPEWMGTARITMTPRASGW